MLPPEHCCMQLIADRMYNSSIYLVGYNLCIRHDAGIRAINGGKYIIIVVQTAAIPLRMTLSVVQHR